MTISDWLEAATNKLSGEGIESARLDSQILLEKRLGVSRESLLATPGFELSKDDITELQAQLERRAKHEPIAYITGVRDFYGLEIQVNKNVLVPRPETEKMVEHILSSAKPNSRVLDVGTGSGAIAIALKHNRDDLEVSALEVSPQALEVARINAANHNAFIGFIRSDLFNQLRAQKQYDIIPANLPYVPLEKIADEPSLKHEPAIALFPDDSKGMSLYERFFREVKEYLAEDGFVIIEHDPAQLEDLEKLGKIAKFNHESISPFITKFSRIPVRNIHIN